MYVMVYYAAMLFEDHITTQIAGLLDVTTVLVTAGEGKQAADHKFAFDARLILILS